MNCQIFYISSLVIIDSLQRISNNIDYVCYDTSCIDTSSPKFTLEIVQKKFAMRYNNISFISTFYFSKNRIIS